MAKLTCVKRRTMVAGVGLLALGALGALGALVAACAAPGRQVVSPSEGAAQSARVLAEAKAKPWVRMGSGGTFVCVPLPDGTFHKVTYAVGGSTDGLAFVRTEQVPVTRDVACSVYGVTALGDNGVVSSFDGKDLRAESTYPTATSLHYGRSGLCMVDPNGEVFCGQHPFSFDANKFGPVAELLGYDCARYRAGPLRCFAPGLPDGSRLVWANTRSYSAQFELRSTVRPAPVSAVPMVSPCPHEKSPFPSVKRVTLRTRTPHSLT